MAEEIIVGTPEEPEYYLFPNDRNAASISEASVEYQGTERIVHFRMDGRRYVLRETLFDAFPDIRDALYAIIGKPLGIDEITGKPRYSEQHCASLGADTFTEPPPGCLGEMSGPKAAENPGLADVIYKAKSGYYLEQARKKDLPQRYDERGTPIPAGCLGSRKEAREAKANTDPVKAHSAQVRTMAQMGYNEFLSKMRGGK